LTPRAELEAMNTRAGLEAALAKAEAEFAEAATNLANGYAVRAETEANLPDALSNLAKARASCLAARNALAGLNIAEGKPIAYRYERRRMTNQAAPEKAHANRRKAIVDRRRARSARTYPDRAEPIVKTDKLTTGAVNDPDLGTSASPSSLDVRLHSTQSNPHLVRAARESAARRPRPQKESRRLAGRFAAPAAGTKDTCAWRLLAWQAAELSSLMFAYLAYYYVDVNLQIAMLPPPVSSLLVG
jgi:hypothetical protein